MGVGVFMRDIFRKHLKRGGPPSVKRVQHESTDYVTLLEPRPLPRSLHVDMETKFGDDRRPDAGSSPRERTAGPVGKTAVPVKLQGSSIGLRWTDGPRLDLCAGV